MRQILAICLLFILLLPVFSQNKDDKAVYSDIHQKYFRYRNRLQYFIVFGRGQGHGLLSTLRNRDTWFNQDGIENSGDEFSTHPSITFGQSFTRSGYLLGALVLEYKLWLEADIPELAETTLKQINDIIAAFNRCDMCESGPPWFMKDTLDGFFIREDMPPVLSDTMFSVLNKGLNGEQFLSDRIKNKEYGFPARIYQYQVECLAKYNSESSFYFLHRFPGDPDAKSFTLRDSHFKHYYQEQKFTSQDEAIGALVGLSLCVHLIDDSSTKAEAAHCALRMLNYLSGYQQVGETKWWRPRFPDGTLLGNNNGGDVRAFAFPLKFIGEDIIESCNLQGQYPGIENAPYYPSYFEGAEISSYSNFGEKKYRILRFMTSQCLTLSGESRIFRNPVSELSGISKKYNWDTFYLLLYAALHNMPENALSKYYDYDKLLYQLSSAPENGTYNYLFGNVKSPAEWSAEFKWSSSLGAQNENNNERWSLGNYSGVDFIILHNLACYVLKDYRESFVNYSRKNHL
ncbi:MAG: hypothetical protein JXR53_14155 [Bacteroidales bacterium]|nr:hypothetical protein [Bacteroidales bacterium]